MRESASRGFWVSSYAPFGYNRVMVQDGAKKRPTLKPNPDEARIVNRIFDMAEAGKGMTEITKTLNDEGILSPRGKLWGKTSVHAILINEAYTGTLLWGVNSKDNAEPVRVEKAFPAIISKAQFRRVSKLMRSRAPKAAHPRRVASTYLLSGLVKCKSCKRALSGQDAKSGQFAYYVCQSIMKRGKEACHTPKAQCPPLRADDRRQDSLQHPHRKEHYRAGESRGRGDGWRRWRAAEEAGDHRG